MHDHRAALVYHPHLLRYDFGPYHPLRPERITAGLDLLIKARLWNAEAELLTPIPATDAELELVHDRAFIQAVQRAGGGELAGTQQQVAFGLSSSDNPPFPDMHYAAALVAGGSVQAARQIMNGALDHAFNPAGGLHHASHGRASGFCIYNDPAVAAAVAVREFGARVAYVDFDCHHGDGVQSIFYDRPDVLTVSFHESGRWLFPGTGDVDETGEAAGRGYSINVPFAPFTQDDSWLEAMHSMVPALIARFKPDLLISSHGCDTHEYDPLTHLSLSTRSFVAQAQLLHQLAHQHCDGRWLAVGSGGYDWRRVVPRSWAIVWAEMTCRQLDETLPAAWLDAWTEPGEEPLPRTFADPSEEQRQMPRKSEIDEINRAAVQAARGLARLG